MSTTHCAPTVANSAPPICPPAPPCPPTACTPSSYTCGDWTHSISADCTHTRTRTSNNFLDGTYQNPTITIENGCISRIVAGSYVLQSRPEPCTQRIITSEPEQIVQVSNATCNLLTVVPGGLFAGLSIDYANSNVTIAGCGTPISPLTFNAENTIGVMDVQTSTLSRGVVGNVITLDTTGVNYDNCGIRIVAGLVKSFTTPITSILPGAGISVTQDDGACPVTISATYKILTGVSCGGTFVDPQDGTLPANASWSSINATVEGVRLFIHSAQPSTVFNEFGSAIASAPSMQVYATNGAAMAALATLYSFAGNASC